VLLLLALAAAPLACVERRLHIRTDPEGAVVRVNGTEVGRSPCAWRFDHYGTVIVEADLEGYEPRQAVVKLKIPWYQRPVADFLADVVYPGKIHDDHEVRIALPPRHRIGPGDEARVEEEVKGLVERAGAAKAEASGK